jgi:DNA-binding NtrC family response regulator
MEYSNRNAVLLVDDEPMVRRLMRRSLQQAGYPVIEATNGRDALARFRDDEDHIGIVVSDVMMPEMSGVDLARQLLELRPGLPIVFVSGHHEGLPHSMREFPVLAKPFHLGDLLSAVENSISGRADPVAAGSVSASPVRHDFAHP